MKLETIRRISLARHMYQLGVGSLSSKNDLYLFSAVNLLQDAVEAFLIGVGAHVKASIGPGTNFNQYFDLINAKITPKELPFRDRLTHLNRIRVDSKHYGIQPARDECQRVALSVREFFDEVSTAILGVSFSTVSVIDLIDAGEMKSLLLEAKASHEAADYEACVIACRKALYVAVEKQYNVAEFETGERKGIMTFSFAPYYARNPQYIKENVKDPTDYIVLDHSRVDQDLMKQGVDTTAFWNVWRLTPQVYRTEADEWIVKHEFGKLDAATIADKAEYVFSTTVDIALAIESSRKAVRWERPGQYFLTLAREEVPVYEKADTTSKVVGTTRPGLTQMDTDCYVAGLKDDGPYWSVRDLSVNPWLWGFIHDDDVQH